MCAAVLVGGCLHVQSHCGIFLIFFSFFLFFSSFRENQLRCRAGNADQTPLPMPPTRPNCSCSPGVPEKSPGDKAPPLLQPGLFGMLRPVVHGRLRSFPLPRFAQQQGCGCIFAGISLLLLHNAPRWGFSEPQIPPPCRQARVTSLTGLRMQVDVFGASSGIGGWHSKRIFNRSGGEQREGASFRLCPFHPRKFTPSTGMCLPPQQVAKFASHPTGSDATACLHLLFSSHSEPKFEVSR